MLIKNQLGRNSKWRINGYRLGQLLQKRTSVGKFEEKLVNTLFLIKIMC